MCGMMNEAIEKLRAQQAKVDEWSPVHMVAEQLIDICRNEPESAEIIAQDLDNEKMSIVEAEKKIKALADAHKPKDKSGGVGVSPLAAEKALRDFYGLPQRDEAPPDDGKTLNFLDFMR